MAEMNNETNAPVKPGWRKGQWIGLAVAVVLLLGVAAGAVVVGNNFDRHVENGQTAVAVGDWTTAVSSFDQALSVQPAFLQRQPALAQGLRGVARYQQNSLAVALTDLNAALSADDSLVDLYVYRSDIHFQQGDLTQALADSEAALGADVALPDHLRALLAANRAVIYNAAGDLAAAERETEAGLALAAYLSEAQLVQLQAIRTARDLAGGDEAAAAQAEAILASGVVLPNATRARLLAGQTAVFYERGDLAAALTASDAALSLAAELDEATVTELHEVQTAVYLAQNEWEAAAAAAELAAGDQSAFYQAVRAWQAYRQFDEAAALNAAEAALALDDENALAYRVRGIIRVWQGHVYPAREDLERALALDPHDVEAAAMLVKVALRLNDPDLAETALAQTLDAGAEAPAALWAQALWHNYYYRLPEARAHLDAAIALDNTRPEIYSLRAFVYTLSSDRLTLAAADIESALALNPDFGMALVAQTSNLLFKNELEDVEAVVMQLLEVRPDWALSHITHGRYLIHVVNDEAGALAAFTTAIELLPESTTPYNSRGFIYLGQGEMEQAEAEFNHALSLVPDSTLARGGLMELALLEEEYDRALALLAEAGQIDPYSQDIEIEKARIHFFFMEDIDAGWELIHQVVARDPQDPRARPLQALFYVNVGQLDEAVDILSEHLAIYPKDPFALQLRAQFYLDQNNVRAARQDAQRAVELAPATVVDAYRILAILAWEDGRTGEAERHLQTMLANDPASEEAYRLLGLLALNSDDPETAVATYNEALTRIPDNQIFHFLRGLAYSNLANREQAEEDFNRALDLSDNVNLIAEIEEALAESGSRPELQDGRYVITNREYGFTIAYSDPWMSEPPEPGSPLDVLLVYDTRDYYAEINVLALDGVDAGFTPRDFFALVSANLSAVPGLTTVATGSVQLGSNAAFLHDYELAVAAGFVFKGRQYYFVSGGKAAIVTFETFLEDFDDLLPEFDEIIATFAFLP
jgi:tetratricopeptide (TPR) repeat protein